MKTLSRLQQGILTVLLVLTSITAHAAGQSGIALGLSSGAAGGARVSSESGTPAVAAGLELGGLFEGGSMFAGAFYDRFTSTLWQAGITARKCVGSSRQYWGQIKVSLSGLAGMIGGDAEVKEWNNYINGGLAAGMRIPLKGAMTLQPFVGFDSFLPVTGTDRVNTSPTESEFRILTGSRAFIPMAGARLALEF